jgi:transposase-like protein
MVTEHQGEHASQWTTICSIAAKTRCGGATLRGRVRQAKWGLGQRDGMTSEARVRLKALSNVFSHVPASEVREASHMLKAIHSQETQATAEAKASAVVNELRRQRMGRAADHVDTHVVRGTLTYYAFSDCHWIMIRTNNPLERIMREIRGRTRVVGAFPDGQSRLNLAAARLRHIACTQWSTRK